MELLKKNKNIIIGIAVVSLVALAYVFLFNGKQPASENLLLSGVALQAPEDALRNQLLELLLQLRVLHLDEAIFKDPIFTSLNDFSVELLPQPVGRNNPFLPLSGTSSGGSETTGSSVKGATITSQSRGTTSSALPGGGGIKP